MPKIEVTRRVVCTSPGRCDWPVCSCPAEVLDELRDLVENRSWQVRPETREAVTKAIAEIERLRMRLAKIAHAPVPTDNEIAMTLKCWALARDGEFPHA